MSCTSIRAVTGEDRVTVPGARVWAPGSRRPRAVLLPLLLACTATVLVPPVASAETAAVTKTPHVWLGPDGAPLPFENDDDILEFLRTSEVVSRRTLEEGINHYQQLLLESSGVRVHAIFRTLDRELRRTRRPDGRYYVRWVDHHAGECAAYQLARALGLRSVPPAVSRRLGSTEGSVQIWVEGALDMTASDYRYPSPMGWVKKGWDRVFFDNLILNVDRNLGILVIGPDYEVWLIDHGRAFQPKAELLEPEMLERVNRKIWDRLQSMSDEELTDVVRDHLDVDQMVALVERRALLAEHVQALVDEHGEAAVFY